MTPATTAAPAAEAPQHTLLDKARAVTAKMTRLKRDFDGAHRLAHDAQVREALVRTELTLALNASLAARAELEARLRERAVADFAGRGERPLRRVDAKARRLDRRLAGLGAFGQAVVIARSGVWRGTGRRMHDLRHMAAYARRRARADVVPLTPLDQAWYLETYPEVAAAGVAPLVHYLVDGGYEGRAPGPLFDPDWYARQAGDELEAAGVTPLEHYLCVGAVRGLSPHPLFDPGYYLAQVASLAPGVDPLTHFLTEGAYNGRSPHPLFDPGWYADQSPELGERTPFLHYLVEGWRAGFSPHPLFDPAGYLRQYPEVAEAGHEPLAHFVAKGGFEGKDPSAWFDTGAYVEARGGALKSGVNPLVDYLRGGAWATAEPRPGFPTAAYLASRPDLARTGLTPLEHWARRAGR